MMEWATLQTPSPQPGMTAAYCKVTLGALDIALTPEELDERHRESLEHRLKDPDDPVWGKTDKNPANFATGMSRPERTATTDCTN